MTYPKPIRRPALTCEGECSVTGACRGEVRRYGVLVVGRSWSLRDLCETGRRVEVANGGVVEVAE